MRISDWSSDVCSSDLLSMTQVLSQTIGTSLPTLSTCYPCHRIILLPISPDRTLRSPLPRGERDLLGQRTSWFAPPLSLPGLIRQAMGAARTDLSGEVRCGGGVDPRDEHEDDGLGGGGDRATPSAARWGISESAPRCRTAAGMARRGMSYRFCRQGRRAASAGAPARHKVCTHMEEVMRLRIPR